MKFVYNRDCSGCSVCSGSAARALRAGCTSSPRTPSFPLFGIPAFFHQVPGLPARDPSVGLFPSGDPGSC